MFESFSSAFVHLAFLMKFDCFSFASFLQLSYFVPVDAFNYHFSHGLLIYHKCIFIFDSFQLLWATAKCFFLYLPAQI